MPFRTIWPEFDRPQVLFNIESARCLIAEFDPSVVVVDGYFECMKVHQAGFPSVVALTGPSLSDVQEQLLTDRFYLIALFLNSREISHRMAAQLMKSIACAMTRCCALLALLALVGVAGVAIHKSNHQ